MLSSDIWSRIYGKNCCGSWILLLICISACCCSPKNWFLFQKVSTHLIEESCLFMSVKLAVKQRVASVFLLFNFEKHYAMLDLKLLRLLLLYKSPISVLLWLVIILSLDPTIERHLPPSELRISLNPPHYLCWRRCVLCRCSVKFVCTKLWVLNLWAVSYEYSWGAQTSPFSWSGLVMNIQMMGGGHGS